MAKNVSLFSCTLVLGNNKCIDKRQSIQLRPPNISNTIIGYKNDITQNVGDYNHSQPVTITLQQHDRKIKNMAQDWEKW